MPREVFTAGQVLTAAELNVVSDQSVMVFAGTAARGSAIPSPTEGMVTYREDDDVVEVYNGSSFVPVGPGQILQVVSTNKGNAFSASLAGTSFSSNVTGLEATITPSSSSSKILVQVSASGARTTDLPMITFRIMRDSTPVGVGSAPGNRTPVTSVNAPPITSATGQGYASAIFLDSPATTSAITYGIQLFNASTGTQTVYLNQSHTNANVASNVYANSTITLMEVAG